MRIDLNPELKPVEVNERTAKTRAEYRAGGHQNFALQFSGWKWMRDIGEKVVPTEFTKTYSRELFGTVVRGLRDHEQTQIGFSKVVAQAYSDHLGLVVHPHDIWYVVLSNIAAIVGEHPDHYRGLYTTSDEKQEISILCDHPTDINVNELIRQLDTLMPVDISIFLPDLSTATPEAKLAMSAAVLDAAKHYYDFSMFCCGIPFIDLRGIKEDWQALMTAIINMDEAIAKLEVPQLATRLSKYLVEVYEVIRQIALTYDQDQTEFWLDIFTKKNVGSGGDLAVSGWIADLYYNVKRGDLFNAFHDCVSSFPYSNKSTGQNFMMFHGGFGSNIVDGAIETAYDYVVVEYTPKA